MGNGTSISNCLTAGSENLSRDIGVLLPNDNFLTRDGNALTGNIEALTANGGGLTFDVGALIFDVFGPKLSCKTLFSSHLRRIVAKSSKFTFSQILNPQPSTTN
ncbi:MAG: hypothetical protein ACLQUR_04795 [Limisphaerales bacterium]